MDRKNEENQNECNVAGAKFVQEFIKKTSDFN